MKHVWSSLMVIAALAACSGDSDSGPQPAELALTVSAAEARSCELRLQEGTNPISGIRWADSVTGTHRRQGSRTAVAFFTKDDAAIDQDAILLQVDGPNAEGIEVTFSRCFGKSGQVLPEATVRLGGAS